MFIMATEEQTTTVKLGTVEHACRPRALELEPGQSEIQGHPWLHRQFEASLDCLQFTFCQLRPFMLEVHVLYVPIPTLYVLYFHCNSYTQLHLVYAELGIKPRASCVLREHSAY